MFLRKGRMTIGLSLMLAVLVGFGGLAAPVLTDVSKDHWAYKAVLGLVDKGYLSVYNDGSFRGDEPVSRYLLAFVVAKMLTDLEKGTVSATDEDMSVLRQVANELRGELVPLIAALDTRVRAVEASSSDSNKAMTAERQERKAEAASILNEIDAQAKLVVGLGTSMGKVETKVAELERAMVAEAAAEKKLIDALKAENDAEKLVSEANKAATDANKAELVVMKAQLETNRKAAEAAVSALGKAQADTQASVLSLDAELEALRKALSDDIGRSVADLSRALSEEAAARKRLEQEGVENLAAALSALKAAADAEAASERALIEQVRKEGLDGRASISASVEQLRKAQESTDAKVEAVNKELTLIKGALGQDIEKAVLELSGYLDRESQGRKQLEAKLATLEAKLAALEQGSKEDLDSAVEQLRQWAEEQHAMMAGEFDEKLGEVSSASGKQIEALAAEMFAKIEKAGKEADLKLSAAMEALKAYSNEETRVRILADDQIYAKLAELDAALGVDLEKAVVEVMAAIGAQKAASSQAQAASDAKLLSEISKLKALLSQEDDSTRSMVLRNVIELQNRDSELEKSIADLRILMDEARLSISQLKDRIGAVESRLSKLEGNVDILRANLESAAALLNSVNSELSRQKVLQGTLETRLADLTASTDAKFKKQEKDSTILMEAQDIAAQEREAKLNQKISSLEQSIAKQAEDFNASLKKATGLGITGLVIGALGLVVGIIAIFLPMP